MQAIAGLMLAMPPIAYAGPNAQTLFVYNEGGYPCTRIPSLLALSSTSADGGENKRILAFVECRMFKGDGCEPLHPVKSSTAPFGVDRYLCMKSSSDGGKTWGALQSNITGGRVANPSAIYVPETNTVLVQYDNPTGYANKSDSGGIWQVASTDMGKTWGTPRNLTSDCNLPAGYHLGTAGSGTRISVGTHKGRLLFTGYVHIPKPNNTLHARSWHSDDHGASWVASPQLFPHMGEPQMSEVLDRGGRQSAVAIVARNNNHVGCKCRFVASSSDGGTTWSPTAPVPSLPDPACEGPIAPDPRQNGQGLLSITPSAAGRTGLAIYSSNAANLTGAWKRVLSISNG